MKQIKKSALFAAVATSIASSAFAGFIDVTGTTDFTTIVPGSSTDMFWADLGTYTVPNGFTVDINAVGGLNHTVGNTFTENNKTFGSLVGGSYQILFFLADPINPTSTGGDIYSETLDVSAYGRVSGVSYWDGRDGVVDPIADAITLVNGQGGGFTFDSVLPGRGLENHQNIGLTQDALSLSADLSQITFDLWAHQLPGSLIDENVDMGFIFVAPIPEPSSIVFALTGGVLGLLVYRNAGRRRQS